MAQPKPFKGIRIEPGQSLADVVASIKDGMAKAQVSQRVLAKQIGMDEGQMSRMLNGKTDLRLTSVLRLFAALAS